MMRAADERTVPQLVAQSAAATPTAAALIAGERVVTYGELNRRANQLAWHLRTLGVGPETPVALCMERSPEFVIALLGILKAGGAYVPLDPAYPAARLAYLLADAQAPVLLTQEDLAANFAQAAAQVIALEAAEAVLAAQPTDDPPLTANGTNLAYIIYTSGSTGQPKGVEITHSSLLNLVTWHHRAFAVTAQDRATHLAGVAFDATGWELWPYLTLGATICLPDDETRVDPVALQSWLIAQGITITFLPTALAEQLLPLPWPEATPLRFMLTGADRLTRYPSSDLPFALVNNYGPTESTVVATSAIVAPTTQTDGPPPIGRPIQQTEIYLLDEDLRQVPLGAVGEIYIGGASLARGYHHRPALTAERFIRHPFSHDAGARLYKTGDLARSLPDGQLAFVGRSDDQIKLRGYRIEPGEIVQALQSYPGIAASVVMAHGEQSGEKRLVAYVVWAGEAELSVRGLQTFLQERLPEYMVPALFVRLATLPITPNGKIDRQSLPLPDATNTLRDAGGSDPTTVIEEQLRAIITELLSVGPISLDDNFFLLGGHSLLGTQAIARISDAFGVELTLRALFEAPTVRQLAGAIATRILAQLEATSGSIA
jgi:amino acid adenylation domain-containing protein